LASKKNPTPDSEALPFGAGTFDAADSPAPASAPRRGAREERPARSASKERPARPAKEPAAKRAKAAPARAPEPEPEPAPEPAPKTPPAPVDSAEGEERDGGRRRRRRGGRGRGRGGAEGARDEAPSAAPAPAAPASDELPFEGEPAPAVERSFEPERGDGDEDAAAFALDPSEVAAPSASGDESLGPVDPSAAPPRRSGRAERRRRWLERRRRRRLGLPLDDLAPGATPAPGGSGSAPQGGAPHGQRHPGQQPPQHGHRGQHHGQQRGQHQGQHQGHQGQQHGHPHPQHPPRERPAPAELREVEGLLVVDKGNQGELRRSEAGWLPSKDDVFVPPWMIQKFQLREGALLKGTYRRSNGRYKWELVDLLLVDGKDPREVRNLPVFKNLVTIDPDFHYALGDGTGEVALKVIDVICPIGRGQRGLIVAPPRSGKTILLQQIAKGFEQVYPDVHVMVLLVDERPEEATEWKRAMTKAEVFVSTNDEPAKKHVELAEVVWRRARHLVELGQDVLLLLDSITRLGRAANNVYGTSGKTMSGGIDTRAMERPKALFGSARNTEKAGSLTIIGTTLVDTGSRMDQVIFEEFKGTGNMELVLSRKLADRRIFPAIDVEKSGTRKEEKLHSARRLTRVHVLRRVLMRMHFAEAMELLITKLEEVDKIDDFLQRFEIDPDAGEDKKSVSPVRMRW
jgi:transcription termination factor Rho